MQKSFLINKILIIQTKQAKMPKFSITIFYKTPNISTGKHLKTPKFSVRSFCSCVTVQKHKHCACLALESLQAGRYHTHTIHMPYTYHTLEYGKSMGNACHQPWIYLPITTLDNLRNHITG